MKIRNVHEPASESYSSVSWHVCYYDGRTHVSPHWILADREGSAWLQKKTIDIAVVIAIKVSWL